MTPKQIRNLLVRNGFTHDELKYVSCGNDSVEVLAVSDAGHVDYDMTETITNRVMKITNWGGFKTGYGAWLLRKGYTVSGTDYCDKSNPIHY